MIKRSGTIAGWCGLVLIHGSTAPTIYLNLTGATQELPPLSMMLMLFFGLGLFLWNSIVIRNLIYFVSNLIGVAGQSCLLALHFFGG